MPSTPYQHLHKGMLNYSLIIRESLVDWDGTHWLLIGTSIILPSPPEEAPDSGSGICYLPEPSDSLFQSVAQQKEAFPHLLTWQSVMGMHT